MRRGSTHATATHDAGHVRRRAAAGGVVLALAVGALAGCTGGDPAPDWTPTTATPIAHPTPTPSADPATVKPERPAAMDTFDSAGAEAVAVYYMQLYPYVFATGDLTEWKTLSHPECIFCSDVARQVQEQHHVEERRVPRERVEIDRVGSDQAERDQEQSVEPPLPRPEDAGRFPGGRG